MASTAEVRYRVRATRDNRDEVETILMMRKQEKRRKERERGWKRGVDKVEKKTERWEVGRKWVFKQKRSTRQMLRSKGT